MSDPAQGMALACRRAAGARASAKEGPMRQQRFQMLPLLLSAALLVSTGCATRGWVKERMGEQKTETDQRIATVETKVGQVDAKVGEEGQRIGGVEARVTEQGQAVQGMGTRMGTFETSVKGANERADGAMARANEVDGRVTRLWNNRDARTLVETV